jgi:hypothetical protein
MAKLTITRIDVQLYPEKPSTPHARELEARIYTSDGKQHMLREFMPQDDFEAVFDCLWADMGRKLKTGIKGL